MPQSPNRPFVHYDIFELLTQGHVEHTLGMMENIL